MREIKRLKDTYSFPKGSFTEFKAAVKECEKVANLIEESSYNEEEIEIELLAAEQFEEDEFFEEAEERRAAWHY